MIPWIQVYSNLIRHPKTTNLADELKLSCKDTSPNVVAAGMLVSLWLWASQNATNGDLSGCSDRAIAEAAEYRKKPESFVTALIKTKWLDSDRKLHDWEEYATLLNDCVEQQKEKTRERVKRHRERKKAAANANVTPECNGTGNVTDTPGNAPTTPYHTVPNLTSNITGADGDITREEADSELLAKIGLKPGEYVLTEGQVYQTIANAKRLFGKFREGATPKDVDCRMVYLLSGYSPDAYGLLEYAFEQAQIAGKVNDWRYIAGVKRTLDARNITTVEQARAWDEERPDLAGEESSATLNNMLKKYGVEV